VFLLFMCELGIALQSGGQEVVVGS
jgi:hypothetical protein